jgi:flagellar assembly factor FliW
MTGSALLKTNNEDMTEINTRFGPITFSLKETIKMINGPIGFLAGQNFGFAKLPQDTKDTYLLFQNMAEDNVSFITLPIDPIKAGYTDADIEKTYLELKISRDKALWFVIINMQVENDKPAIFGNFGAPLIIDSENLRGWQHIIPNPNYEVRRKLS